MNMEFPEDSDSSDEDYIPAGAAIGDVPSEVDSDGDPEDPLSDPEDSGSRSAKKRKKTIKKKKLTGNGDYDSGSTLGDSPQVQKVITEEEKKKHADDLWASFKKDTDIKSKPTADTTTAIDKKETVKVEPKKAHSETVKVTQIFEFAGEEVKIEKVVKADSMEARLSQCASGSATAETSNVSEGAQQGPPKRKVGLGGIGSVLNQIGKKQKLSTLEKSKLDWNQYKQKQNIEDELDAYKKGKDGYLDRQDFLQRADLRRFEIEKEVRTIERNKRMNNAP